MRRLVVLLGLCGVAAFAFLGYSQIYPKSYSYRYRLAVAFEINGEVRSGTSVIEVRWVKSSRVGELGPFQPHLSGQAVLVEVPPRGALVAMLGHPWRNHGRGAALWIGARAFGNQSTTAELPKLASLSGRRKLSSDDIPELLWLPDASDVSTATRITVGDLPKLFGPKAYLLDASVEITTDPVIMALGQKLPWYEQLVARQKGHLVVSRPGEDLLNYHDFVGDD